MEADVRRLGAREARVADLELDVVERRVVGVDDRLDGGVRRHQVRVAVGGVPVVRPGVPLTPQADQAQGHEPDPGVGGASRPGLVVTGGEGVDEADERGDDVGVVVVGADRAPESVVTQGHLAVEAGRDAVAGVGGGAARILDVEAEGRLAAPYSGLVQRLVEDRPVEGVAAGGVLHDLVQSEVAPYEAARVLGPVVVAGEQVGREALERLTDRGVGVSVGVGGRRRVRRRAGRRPLGRPGGCGQCGERAAHQCGGRGDEGNEQTSDLHRTLCEVGGLSQWNRS